MAASLACVPRKIEEMRSAAEEERLCADLLRRIASVRGELKASTADSERLSDQATSMPSPFAAGAPPQGVGR